MPQRFKMPDPFHRCRNRLLIDHRAFIETDGNAKTVRYRPFQHFQLHFTHHADQDLSLPLCIFLFTKDPKLRILFLQHPKLR